MQPRDQASMPIGPQAGAILAAKTKAVEQRVKKLERKTGRALVAGLPTSPFDSQEVLFQTAAMFASGFSPWHLRYNASWVADAYKWHCVGAAPMSTDIDANETTTATAHGDLTAGTIGPSVVIPLAGVFSTALSAGAYHPTAGQYAVMSFAGPGLAATDNNGSVMQAAIANQEIQLGKTRNATFTAAGTVTAKYRGTAAGAGFYRRSLTLTPIRVG